MKRIQRVILTVKTELDAKDAAVDQVLRILRREKIDVIVDARAGHLHCTKGYKTTKRLAGADAIVVIGGDGTILRTVREMGDFSMPILSVNRGAIGFLAEANIDEADELLPKLLRGKGIVEKRALLAIDVIRKGKVRKTHVALNEAVIAQGAIARILDVRTAVNGEPLATFHADGLVIATPTGSTAYSLAAGGPIVHPRLSSIILTPLNPHSFSQKPIVLPGSSVIDVEVLQRVNKFLNTEVSLTFDGQTYVPLEHGDALRVKTHDQSVLFLRRREDTFFATLRSKLKWGEHPEHEP